MKQSILNRRFFGRILLGVVLFFVTWYMVKYAGGFFKSGLKFSYINLLLCLLCSAAGHLCNLAIWRSLVASFGISADFSATGKAWFVSRMGRHVPGKVAVILVRMNLYGQESKSSILAATFIEYIASVVASWFLVSFSFLVSPVALPKALKLTIILASLCLAVSLTPRFLPRLMAWALRILKKQADVQSPSFSLVLRFVGAYWMPVLFHGMAFFFLIRAVFPISFSYFLFCVGIYNAASLAGLAALFAPSGIGVREGFMFLTLPLIVPKSVAVAVAVGIRLVNMVTEALLAGVFCIVDLLGSKSASAKPANNEKAPPAAPSPVTDSD